MKFCYFPIVLALLSGLAGAQSGYAEKDVIEYAKRLPLRKLDRMLSSQKLDDWLRSTKLHLDTVTWRIGPDCATKERAQGASKKKPLCVGFVFGRTADENPVDGWGSIEVGTVEEGIIGVPRFRYFEVGSSIGGYVLSDRLSDLSLLLKKASSLPDSDKRVLSYAQAIDVQKLDPTLPSRQLGQWLRFGPPHIDKLIWEMNVSCDLKGPGDEVPLCVKVVFRRSGESGQRGNISGQALIRVGTFRNGISGSPHFEYFAIIEREAPQPPIAVSHIDDSKLSDLPRALDGDSPQTKTQ